METSEKAQYGTLKVSDDVVATIARMAAKEIDGVESISNPNVTFKQLFFKSSKNDSIKIKPVGDVVEVSISVIAKQGHKVTTLAEAIQERVKTDVQSMTGVTVSRVNVSVAGISFEANN